jgi:hypothetical protein
MAFKITAAKYSCPYWFSDGARSLIQRIIDPNPRTVSTNTNLFLIHFLVVGTVYSDLEASRKFGH